MTASDINSAIFNLNNQISALNSEIALLESVLPILAQNQVIASGLSVNISTLEGLGFAPNSILISGLQNAVNVIQNT